MDFDQLIGAHHGALQTCLDGYISRDVMGLDASFALHPDGTAAVGQEPLRQLLRDHFATGGKRLRGLLPIALVGAGGGPLAAAIHLGAAIEVVHNGTLVHDDVQDGDRLRRGQPTLWAQHGIAQAINAGDAMLVAPLVWLLRATEIDTPHRAPLAQLLGHAIVETIRGQVADVAWRDLAEPDADALLGVHLAKTGPLFGVCLQGAALLLDRPEGLQGAHRAARELGLAFQIRDDLLDMEATKGRGTAGADLREGKVTVPLLLAAKQDPTGFAELSQALKHPRGPEPMADAEVARWVAWAHESGGMDAARTLLQSTLERCVEHGERALGRGPGEVLRALAQRLGHTDG